MVVKLSARVTWSGIQTRREDYRSHEMGEGTEHRFIHRQDATSVPGE
jgi:hypothetical protein